MTIWKSYAIAILNVLAATLLTQILEPLLAPTILPPFFAAVALSSWFGGLKPGLLAAVLSILSVNYFFSLPTHALINPRLGDLIRLGFFFAVAVTSGLLNSTLQQVRQAIEQLCNCQLQQTEEQLRLALQAAGMGMWHWDMVTREIVWTPEHERIFGFALGTFDGRYETFEACVYPSDRQNLQQAVEKAIQEHGIYQHEYRIIWPDGSIHWVEGRGQAFYDEAGQPIRMSGTIVNIDDRKHAEEAIRRSEERYRSLISATFQIVWTTDSEGNNTSVSPSWLELTGQPREAFQPWGWVDYLHPDDRDRAIQDWKQSVASQTLYETEFRFKTKDNTYRNFLVRGVPVLNPDGTIREWIGTCTDITEQLATQAELSRLNVELEQRIAERTAQVQRTSALLNNFFNAASSGSIGLCIHDREYRFVQINEALAAVNGYSVEAHLGKPAGELLPEFASTLEPIFEQVFTTGQPVLNLEMSQAVPSQPNAIRYWLASYFPILETDSGVEAIGVIMIEISDRKQAEMALQVSQARLAGILDIASDAIISVDAHQRITLFNQGAEKIFGYTTDRVLGQPLNLLIPDRFAAAHEQHVKQFGNSEGKARRMGERTEIFARRQDGTEFPAEASISKLEIGNERFFTAFLRDITERKQAEESLSRLAAIVESSDDAIVSQSLNGTILSWNAAAERLFGYTEAEMIGRSISVLIPPDYWDEMPLMLQKIAQGEPVKHYEVVRVRKDGQLIDVAVTVSPIKDATGKAIAASAIKRDISKRQAALRERKQAEATLRESDRRWRSLLDNVQLIVVRLDSSGNVEYVNPFFLQLTGYTSEEVLGKYWFENFLTPGQKYPVQVCFQEILDNDFHSHYQNSIVTKLGEERMIAWSNTLLQDAQGNAIGTISIGEDITERYKLERMKAEFLSIVSHELRTPLTSISGALELLSTGLIQAESPRGQETLQIAATEADRLIRLVNDILDLERLESGKIRLECQAWDVAELIRRAVDFMQLAANESEITLWVQPLSVILNIDGDRILQVLTNLLSNAIKFSPKGSTISISAWIQNREDDSTDPTLALSSESSEILIVVEDRGRGIPANKLESIFERFQQVDTSDARKKGGTGLGLAICRSIVQQHGGHIWAESILNEGSCFYFTLPLNATRSECYVKTDSAD